MAKKNNKQKKGKTKAKSNKQRKATNTNAPKSGGYIGMAMQACSVTNPFCPEAIGSRWPDNSYTKSVGWSITGTPISLGTSGTDTKAGILLVGDIYNYALMTNTSPVSSPITFSTLAQAVTSPSNVGRYRLTSWGLKISGIVAPLSASGLVRIRLMSPMTGASLASIGLTSTMVDATLDVPLARLSGKDLFIIPAPLGTDARLFREIADTTSTLSSWRSLGWQSVFIGLDGVPAATSCIQVSLYYNYEFVFQDGDSSNAYAQPPPPNNPAVRTANAGLLESVGNFFEGTAQTLDRVFQSKAARWLGKAGAAYYTRSPAPLMIADVD